MSGAALTPAQLARMLRDTMRDRDYVSSTGIGGDVRDFLRWFEHEWGATTESVRTYEYALKQMSVFFADLSLEELEPPAGTDLVRDFWHTHWSDCATTTRTTVLGRIKSFFRWAVEERRMIASPAAAIRYPKSRGVERRAHPRSVVDRLIAAQETEDDAIACDLLGRHALRRMELRLVQARHFNLDAGELTVFGKGGTVIPIPLFPDLLERIARHALRREWQPDEFLIYPYKTGMKGGRVQVIWEDRRRPYSMSGIDRWWRRCMVRAGIDYFPKHEMRHTAGTNFYRASGGDLVLTQKLLRHANAATTARTYLHLDRRELADAMRDINEREGL